MSSPGRLRGSDDALLAVLSVVLGGGSLLLFGPFLAGLDLGLLPSVGGTTARLALDAGLSGAFFLQHSLMLRRGVRSRMARVVPRRRHGTLYAIASGATLAAVVLAWQRTDEVLYAAGGGLRAGLHGLQALAMILLPWAWRALGGFDPFGVAQLAREQDEALAPLAVRGPYRWVRHPLYLAFLVAAWAVPVLTLDRLLFNLLWTGWVVVGCVLEERDLVDAWGDAYRAYRRRVPMLLPWRLRTPR